MDRLRDNVSTFCGQFFMLAFSNPTTGFRSDNRNHYLCNLDTVKHPPEVM